MSRIQTVLLTIMFAAGLAACASNPGSDSAPAADQSAQAGDATQGDKTADTEKSSHPGMYCHQERLPGSHRTTTVCRTPGRMEKDREDAQDALRTRQNATIGAPKGG